MTDCKHENITLDDLNGDGIFNCPNPDCYEWFPADDLIELGYKLVKVDDHAVQEAIKTLADASSQPVEKVALNFISFLAQTEEADFLFRALDKWKQNEVSGSGQSSE